MRVKKKNIYLHEKISPNPKGYDDDGGYIMRVKKKKHLPSWKNMEKPKAH